MKFFKLSIAASFMIAAFAIMPLLVPAQADEASTSTDIISETITANDLGVNDPVILPDSPFYGLKNLWRSLRLTFTFDKVKKAEKSLQYANERVLEAQKLAQKRQDAKGAALLNKTISHYAQDLATLQETTDSIDGDVDTNTRLNQLVAKIAEFDIKRRLVLDNIADNAPESVLLKIMEAKKQSAQSLTKVLARTIPEDEIAQRVDAILQAQDDNNLQGVLDLASIKELSDNAPADMQEKLGEVEDKIIQRFQKRIANLTDEERQQLEDYFANAGIANPFLLPALSDIQDKAQLSVTIKNMIKNIKAAMQENFADEFTDIDSEAVRDQLLDNVDDEEFMQNNQEFVERMKQINADKKEAFKELNEAQREALQERMQEFRSQREEIQNIEDQQERKDARQNLMEAQKEAQQNANETQREQRSEIMQNVQQQRREALEKKASSTSAYSDDSQDSEDDENAEEDEDSEEQDNEDNNTGNSTTTTATTSTSSVE